MFLFKDCTIFKKIDYSFYLINCKKIESNNFNSIAISSISVLFFVFLLTPTKAFTFSILQDGNRNIHTNGYNGILKINSVDNQGNVKGKTTTTTTSDKDDGIKIHGFYDPLLEIHIYGIRGGSNPLNL